MNIAGRQLLKGALLILSLMFAAAASAADQNPCSQEIAKFCKDVGPGRAAIMDCLERHESQLSAACKEYEAKMEGSRVEWKEVVMQQKRVQQACRGDIVRFCSGVKSERGGTDACLQEHASELSKPCQEAIEAARKGSEEKK
jgi:Cysteine rich repeat